MNSKSFNIKVYFKSLRDLDLELVAIIPMPPPPPPTTQETFLSEIAQISLQEVQLKYKGRFREVSEDAHRHGQAKIT